MKVGAEYYFYHNDHLGTPQKMTAVNGLVVWAAKYSSFGKAEVDPGSGVENNLRFPGQYFDGETGLHYNMHRYYDPETGRYLTPDPIGLAGGINPFVYANNNPINLIDPLGLYCKIIWDDPVTGGDPISMRFENKKIGYWDAVIQKIAWELSVAKLSKISKIPGIPFPNIPSPSFSYTLRHTTYLTYYLYVQYWEVCYDDCTGKETSRTPLKPGRTGKTEEVIYKQNDERKFL